MPSDSCANENLATEIAERATRDPAFRVYLISDPRAAIAAVFGVVVPEGVELSIHQSTPTHMHIALAAHFGDDLSEISGGSTIVVSSPSPTNTWSPPKPPITYT